MKKLLTLTLFFLSFFTKAQIMPSPDASAMIKGINTPVNLYNGVASVSIPLYEAESNNGGKIPISLQYQTGGVKVQEISSVAGLGWQLQAGGAITRVVRSHPDDQVKFTTQIKYDQLRDVALGNENYDFEKDLFFFSYPGGGGKFIFSSSVFNDATTYVRCNQSGYQSCLDACGTSLNCLAGCDESYERNKAYLCPGTWSTGKVITLPSSDVQIRFYYRGKLDSYFVITDTQGNKFYFGESSSSREKTVLNSKDNFHNTSYKDENKKEFISTWHLNKIEFASLPANRGITYKYTNASITEEVNNTIVPAVPAVNLYAECMVGKSSGANCDDCMEFNKKVHNPYDAFDDTYLWAKYEFHNKYYRNSITTQKSTIQSKFVSSINFTKGKIKFNYASRSDLTNGLRLASVSLHDHNNKLVSRTELDHSYFSSSDSYYKGDKRGYSGEKGLRLKLDGVRKDGLSLATFDYINDKHFHNGGIDKYELPPRDSYYTDHWGYYNGGPHQGETYTWHKNATVDGNSIAGIKKYITQYAKANILTKVYYPLGGSKEFIYGKHAYHGGVRVDRVIERDEKNNKVADITYSYEDEYDPIDFSYVENHVLTVLQDRNEVTGKIIPHIFESSKTFVFDLNGPTNGYGKVTEENGITGSKAVHEFINAGDRQLLYAEKFFATVDTYQDEYWTNTTTPINIYAFPFSTPTIEFFDRGLEQKVTYYDESGVRSRMVENTYIHDPGFDYSVMNHSFHLYHLDEDAGLFVNNSFEYKFIVSKYLINTRNLKLDYSITKNFNESGNLITENRTDYTYSSEYETIPTFVRSEVKDGVKVLYGKHKKTLYPFNKDEISIVHSNSVLDEMVDKNMIAVPVQNITSVREPGAYLYEYSGNSLTTFKKSHSLIVPYQSYIFPMTGLISYIFYTFDSEKFELISTTNYNDQGLIQSKVGQDNISTSYTYDNQGYLKSARVDPGVESLVRMTQYEYYPLIGVKSITNPNGRKISHKYDERNRLILTRDNDGNILKRYRYNYANENNNLSASLSVADGYNKTCRSVRFVVNKTGQSYGVTKYTWNFGDESNTEECGGGIGPMGESIPSVENSSNSNAYETTNNYASHVFTEPGNYTVSVKIFNPEFGEEKVVTRNITIYDTYALAKIHGPDAREYCSSGGGQQYEANSGATEQQIAPVDDDGSGGNGYPIAYFSVGFDGSGARCQEYGSSLASLKYKSYTSNQWVSFGEDGRGELPSGAFYYSSSPYTIEIMGEISDNCSSAKHTVYHTLTINPCSTSGGTGGGSTGGGGTGGGIDDGSGGVGIQGPNSGIEDQ